MQTIILGTINIAKLLVAKVANIINSSIRTVINGIGRIIDLIIHIFVSIYHFSVKSILFLQKQAYLILVVPFLPSYKVVFSMYQVIPGLPVSKHDSIHKFDKGTGKSAKAFYKNVITSTREQKIIPSEVNLIRRRKVIATEKFGPVEEIKKFNVKKH